jgi:hypothetical protein
LLAHRIKAFEFPEELKKRVVVFMIVPKEEILEGLLWHLSHVEDCACKHVHISSSLLGQYTQLPKPIHIIQVRVEGKIVKLKSMLF